MRKPLNTEFPAHNQDAQTMRPGCLAALTRAYQYGIIICMRTTLNIDDETLKKASELTGVGEKTALVRMGLESLIARQSAQRLAAIGGTEPRAKRIPRRRPGR